MKYLLIFIILLLSGCSIKNYEHNQSKIIIIKSPKIKFADVGYIRHTGDKVQLEMFIAGKMVEKIQINHLICTNNGCLSKSAFNKDYLHKSYPNEILQNVILKRSIYGGLNRINTKSGYQQIIQSEDVDILYKTTQYSVYFKDKKNNILLKIQSIKE